MRPVNGETDDRHVKTKHELQLCKHRNVARVTSHLGYQTLFLVFFLHFCLFLSVCIFSRHHSDQMLEGSGASKVILSVKQSVSQSVTKGRYRAARAATNISLCTEVFLSKLMDVSRDEPSIYETHQQIAALQCCYSEN